MASKNDPYKDHLRGLAYSCNDVRNLIQERSQAVETKMNEYANLSNVQSLEPHLKIQGGPQYKATEVNTDRQKQQILQEVADLQKEYDQKINEELNKDLSERDYEEELKDIKDHDIQELLDEEMQNRSSGELTNADIGKFLKDNDFEPEKEADIDKSDKQKLVENKEDIWNNFDQWWSDKEAQAEMDLEKSKTKEFEINKEDMNIGPEDDL